MFIVSLLQKFITRKRVEKRARVPIDKINPDLQHKGYLFKVCSPASVVFPPQQPTLDAKFENPPIKSAVQPINKQTNEKQV